VLFVPTNFILNYTSSFRGAMKTKITLRILSFYFLIIPLIIFMQSCDIFEPDGTSDTEIIPKESFFYLLERSSVSLVMLNYQLQELKRWNLLSVTNDSSLQGITFDGTYLWISSAGNTDKIFQLDASSDSLVILNSFDAPPTGQGTIRDLTWVAGRLWAINSGSSTYHTVASLYEINPINGSVLTTMDIPTPEPRALTYSNGYLNVYGSGLEAGLYFTDTDKDYVYRYRMDRPYFDTLFSTPIPPRGLFTRYPAGLTFDGKKFWIINSSDVSDILYKTSISGVVEESFQLPYSEPGPIVWADVDVRKGISPSIIAILPVSAKQGATIDVDVFGGGFKPGTGTTADFGTGIQINSVSFVLQTQLRINITLAVDAPLGKRTIKITNPDGQSAHLDSAFEVTQTSTTPFLWLADQASGQRYLYKIRLTDTAVVKEWQTSDVTADGVQGVAFDGTNFWLSSSGTTRSLFKIDVSGNSLVALSTIPLSSINGGTLRGIVWQQGFMWQAVSGNGKIYKISPSNGVVLDSINSPGIEPRGICFANGSLYCNDISIDSVFVYNFSSGTWTSVFATPTPPGGTTTNRFATGLTFDGQTFWIANSTGDFDQIFNLSINGAVLRFFNGPRLGLAQLTGIVVTEE
jgi:hypothetical protein